MHTRVLRGCIALSMSLLMLVLMLPSKTLSQGIASPSSGGLVYTKNGDIHSYDVATGTSTPIITAPGTQSFASVSPDGRRVCFETTQTGDLEIFCTDRYGNNAVNMTRDADAADGMPRFSPDGSKIAYHRRAPGDPAALYQIWIMNADGTGKRQVTSEPRYMGEPQWFPDSSGLVFDGDKPDRNILVSNLDGSGLQVINDQPGEQHSPSVSPDGQFISYASSENGVFQIYRMDADGSNQTALTTPAQGSNRLPKLSRDGNHITFVSDRDGNDEIYIMNADGSNQTRITSTTTAETAPSWAVDAPPPTGTIVFVSDRDGNPEIYRMNVNSTTPQRLTTNTVIDRAPKWSPDGTQIVFASQRDGNENIYMMNADGTDLQQLTNDPGFDGWPAWSSDGTRIAFVSNRNGNNEIYVMNADGTNETRITTTTAGEFWPVWSPDSSRIAFYSDRNGNDEIYVMNADGTGQTRLTNNPAKDWDPSWSLDGKQIFFTTDRDGNEETYVMNADGSGALNLSNNPADDGYTPLSPYGDYIAFTSTRDGNAEIYLMHADGSGQTRLTDDPARDAYPAWQPVPPSPSGLIAFVSDRDGNQEIYVSNPDGSGVRRLTNNPAVDTGPKWSPNGKQIVFWSSRDGNENIYVINADGTGLRQLTTDPGLDTWPTWSADGSKITWSSNRSGDVELYVMDADGSNQTRLTNSAGNDIWAAWSPDGSQIAFYSLRDGNREIYVMDADGSNQTRLTNNTDNDLDPLWSPDGSAIAFVSTRDGNAEIYVMNTDGSGLFNLTRNAATEEHFAWSSDGKYITFSSTRDGSAELYIKEVYGHWQTRLTNDATNDIYPTWQPVRGGYIPPKLLAFDTDRDGNREIYVVDEHGNNLLNLTNHPADDWDPTWSSDGHTIIFISNRDGNDELYRMNADGSGIERLTNTPGTDEAAPDSSREDDWLLFASDQDEPGNTDIYALNLATREIVRMTDDPADDFAPHWSPYGDIILFTSRRDGEDYIYLMNRWGNNEQRFGPGTGTGFAWHSRAPIIIIQDDHSGDMEIYSIDARGEDRKQLTSSAGRDAAPAIAHDGSIVAITSERNGNADIVVMNPDGSGQQPLINTAASEDNPAWQPPTYPYVAYITPNNFVDNAGFVPVRIRIRGGTVQEPVTVKIGNVELLNVRVEDGHTIRAILPVHQLRPGRTGRQTGTSTLPLEVTDINRTIPTPGISISRSTTAAIADITVAAYLACDDEALTAACNLVIGQLQEAISQAERQGVKLSVFVFIDKHGSGNTHYTKLAPAGVTPDYFVPDWLPWYATGETHTGDPQTLEDFLNWRTSQTGRSSFNDETQTTENLVVLYGNGGLNIETEESVIGKAVKPLRGMWWDSVGKTSMTMQDMRKALYEVTVRAEQYPNLGIDTLYLDASLMSNLEAINALAPYTKHIIAHQNVTWFPDPDNSYLDIESLELDTETFARSLVTEKIEQARQAKKPDQLAAIATSNIPDVVEAWEQFAKVLHRSLEQPGVREALQAVFEDVARVEANGDGYINTEDNLIDAYDLARLVRDNEHLPPEVKQAAANVLTAFEAAVVENSAYSGSPARELPEWPLQHLNGISVFWPTTSDCGKLEKYIENYPAPAFQEWKAFLAAWNPDLDDGNGNGCIPLNPPPSSPGEPVLPWNIVPTLPAPEKACMNGEPIWVPFYLEHVDPTQDLRGLRISVISKDTTVLVPAKGLKPRLRDFFPKETQKHSSYRTEAGWDFILNSTPSPDGVSPTEGTVVEFPFYATGAGVAPLAITFLGLTNSDGEALHHKVIEGSSIEIIESCRGSLTFPIYLEGRKWCEDVVVEAVHQEMTGRGSLPDHDYPEDPGDGDKDHDKDKDKDEDHYPEDPGDGDKDHDKDKDKDEDHDNGNGGDEEEDDTGPFITRPDFNCQVMFHDIPAGTYDVYVERSLFVDAMRHNIVVEPEKTTTIDDIGLWAGDLNDRANRRDHWVTNADWRLCKSQTIPTSLESPLYDINGDGITTEQDCQLVYNNLRRPDLPTTNPPRRLDDTRARSTDAMLEHLQQDGGDTVDDTYLDGSDYLSLVAQPDGGPGLTLHTTNLSPTLYAAGARIALPSGVTVDTITLPEHFPNGDVDWIQEGRLLFIAIDLGEEGSDLSAGGELATITLESRQSVAATAQIEAANLILTPGPADPAPETDNTLFLPIVMR